MKKFGFTLAELLISLAIIGVVTVIVLQAATKLSPDRDKIMVIKKYNEISENIEKLLDNQEIYYPTINTGRNPGTRSNDISSCYGLNCTNKPVAYGYTDDKYSGDSDDPYRVRKKLVNLLAAVTSGTVDDDDNPTLIDYPDGSRLAFAKIDDKSSINVYQNNNADYTKARLRMDLCLDRTANTCSTDNDTGIFDPNQPQQTTKYSFYITQFGDILGRDALSVIYLQHPTNVRNRNEDFTNAGNLGGTTSVTTSLKN